MIIIIGIPVSWKILRMFTTLKPPKVMPSSIITPNCSRCLDPLTITIRELVASVPSTVIKVRSTPSSQFPARKRVPTIMTCSRLWGTNGASSTPKILISGLMFLNCLVLWTLRGSFFLFSCLFGGFFSCLLGCFSS